MLRFVKKLLSIFEHGLLVDLMCSSNPRSVASHSMAKQLAFLSPGLKFIIDGGANEGQFSRACTNYFPEARIVAFEPLPAVASILRSNLANQPQVEVVEMALGDVNGKLLFNEYSDSQCSSFLDVIPGNVLTNDATFLSQKTVNVCRIDTYLEGTQLLRPSMLKLDLQGFEKQAILGAGERLMDFDYLLVECPLVAAYHTEASFTEMVVLLASLGFEISGLLNTASRRGTVVQVDALFSRSDTLD
jgi:FkbM family methyltransferase